MIIQPINLDGGIVPTGTYNIYNNGVYDIAKYSNVDVDVGNTEPLVALSDGIYSPSEGYVGFDKVTVSIEYNIIYFGREVEDDTLSFMDTFSFTLPSNITDLGDYALYECFWSLYQNANSVLTSLNLSSLKHASGVYCCASIAEFSPYLAEVRLDNLEDVTGYSAFSNAFSGNPYSVASRPIFTSVSLPKLVIISSDYAFNNAFKYNSALLSFDMGKVEVISGRAACYRMLEGCSSLTSVDVSKVEEITGINALAYAFSGCTALTTLSFNSLRVLTGDTALERCFSNSGITSLYFSALTSNSFGENTSQFNNMLRGCTNVTVHFPSNLQSVIGSWTSVASGFGGTNTTILYDLSETE